VFISVHLCYIVLKLKENFFKVVHKSREDIRNVAIIAHVDHGKTTLVDGLLKQSNIFRKNEAVGNLIMDSNELEREKGITILAKNTAVMYKGVKINIIDTPGHADFGGEVERVLNMADGCLLLIDAVDGPMPQTRFVLSKAFEIGLKPIVVINKIDRPSSRPDVVLGMTQDLFLELATDAEQLDFPVVYTIAKQGLATFDPAKINEATDLAPLFDTILHHVPIPVYDEDAGFQLLVTSLDYNNHLGRIGVGRIFQGKLKAASQVSRIKHDGTITRQKVNQIFTYQGLGKIEVEEAEAGDIIRRLAGEKAPTVPAANYAIDFTANWTLTSLCGWKIPTVPMCFWYPGGVNCTLLS
jgi:GTP-binding protein